MLEETRETALKSETKRLEQMDETKGRKVQDVEDDGFFVTEDVEFGEGGKREVDKRGNVI